MGVALGKACSAALPLSAQGQAVGRIKIRQCHRALEGCLDRSNLLHDHCAKAVFCVAGHLLAAGHGLHQRICIQ